MSRPPRVDYPGAIHHVFNRGANKQDIFLDAGARAFFLELLGETCREHGLVVMAYALMRNHYHLLLRSQRGLLSAGMRSLSGRYTRAVNQRFDRDGPLFRGRFRNRLVMTREYLIHLVAYIHANPARAGLFAGNRWTSRRGMLGGAVADFVEMDTPRSLFATPADYLAYETGVADGSIKGPAGFEGELLSGPEIGLLGPWMELRRPTESEAIRQVVEVTARSAIPIDGRAARHDSDVRLLVWWVHRGGGVPQHQIAGQLGVSQSRVSQIVRQVERELQQGRWSRESAALWAWFDAQVEAFGRLESA